VACTAHCFLISACGFKLDLLLKLETIDGLLDPSTRMKNLSG